MTQPARWVHARAQSWKSRGWLNPNLPREKLCTTIFKLLFDVKRNKNIQSTTVLTEFSLLREQPNAIIRSIREILFSIAAYISGVFPEAVSTKLAKGCCSSAWSAFSTARSACSHPGQSPRWAKISTLLMAMSIGTSFPNSWYCRIRSMVLLALWIVLLFFFLLAVGDFRLLPCMGDNVKVVDRILEGVEPCERLTRGGGGFLIWQQQKSDTNLILAMYLYLLHFLPHFGCDTTLWRCWWLRHFVGNNQECRM